jgi:hypothetical protein
MYAMKMEMMDEGKINRLYSFLLYSINMYYTRQCGSLV